MIINHPADLAAFIKWSKPSMNRGCRGSSSFASCLAIGLCNLPWKSIPTSNPIALTCATRSTVSIRTDGDSSQPRGSG